ncbi:MAG: hypothetical protein WCK29_01730 [archaeon]
MIINELNVERTKKMIANAIEKPVIVLAQDDGYNRKLLEYGKFDILLFSEKSIRKNKLKSVDSGLNDFITGLAKKKHIALGFDLNDLRDRNLKDRAQLMIKIRQNIKICSKIGCKIRLFGSRDEKDSFSLLLSLGMPNKMAKEAISF